MEVFDDNQAIDASANFIQERDSKCFDRMSAENEHDVSLKNQDFKSNDSKHRDYGSKETQAKEGSTQMREEQQRTQNSQQSTTISSYKNVKNGETAKQSSIVDDNYNLKVFKKDEQAEAKITETKDERKNTIRPAPIDCQTTKQENEKKEPE